MRFLSQAESVAAVNDTVQDLPEEYDELAGIINAVINFN